MEVGRGANGEENLEKKGGLKRKNSQAVTSASTGTLKCGFTCKAPVGSCCRSLYVLGHNQDRKLIVYIP